MQLKKELTLIKKENCLTLDYMHIVKAFADEIVLIDHHISEDDLIFYILNGLEIYFWEIAAPIWARKYPLSFNELYDLLVSHDGYLCHLEATTQ